MDSLASQETLEFFVLARIFFEKNKLVILILILKHNTIRDVFILTLKHCKSQSTILIQHTLSQPCARLLPPRWCQLPAFLLALLATCALAQALHNTPPHM